MNTKLWWRATNLPTEPKSKSFSNIVVPCVSYARDAYLDRADSGSNDKDRGGSNMTDLDGL